MRTRGGRINLTDIMIDRTAKGIGKRKIEEREEKRRGEGLEARTNEQAVSVLQAVS